MKETKQTFKVKELKDIISEEVSKQIKIKNLLESRKSIQKDLDSLLEDFQSSNTNVLYQEPENKTGGKHETIFHTKPGNVISLSFQDTKGIKLRRQKRQTPGMIDNDLMWKVEDPSTSVHLKKGDYLEIQGNDNLEKGNKFIFLIHRQDENQEGTFKPIGLKYETNSLVTWLNNA